MDPVTIGFDSVTALVSALSLFLSRLDSRRKHSEELPDLKVSLLQLAEAIEAWEHSADVTNFITREWVESNSETRNRDAAPYVQIALYGQSNKMERVEAHFEWRER
jgi:hypothetical protein